jgi:hypothetical protein
MPRMARTPAEGLTLVAAGADGGIVDLPGLLALEIGRAHV